MNKLEFLALKPEMANDLVRVPDCAEFIITGTGQSTVSMDGPVMRASVPILGHFEWIEADLTYFDVEFTLRKLI